MTLMKLQKRAGGQDHRMLSPFCVAPWRPHNLDWKVPALKLETFVFPSFPFYGWLC